MEVQADKLNILHCQSGIYDIVELRHIYAEFVFIKPCGDIFVGVSVDIRVHTNSDACHFTLRGCNLVDYLHFGQRLHIEAKDVAVDPGSNLFVGFPYTGKGNFISGKSRTDGSGKFSATHAVNAQPCTANQLKNSGIGISLHGVVYLEGESGNASPDFIERILE